MRRMPYEVVFPHTIKGYDYNNRVVAEVVVDLPNTATLIQCYSLLKIKSGKDINRIIRMSIDIAF